MASCALGDYLAQLIKERLGKELRVRADTFGYLQRSFAGCVSEVDQAEARAVGRRAAELALDGVMEGSISIKRVGDDPYAVEYERIELGDVAGKSRTMPDEYIAGSCDISDAFRRYAEPLVGPLPTIERL